jgi:hypothetical protein
VTELAAEPALVAAAWGAPVAVVRAEVAKIARAAKTTERGDVMGEFGRVSMEVILAWGIMPGAAFRRLSVGAGDAGDAGVGQPGYRR